MTLLDVLSSKIQIELSLSEVIDLMNDVERLDLVDTLVTSETPNANTITRNLRRLKRDVESIILKAESVECQEVTIESLKTAKEP